MAKNTAVALPAKFFSIVIAGARTLTTSSSAALKQKQKPLYRRLSELGSASRPSVADVLNGWLSQGRAVEARELMRYVRQLRKYKNYPRALELMEWMEVKGFRISQSFHAVRVDLIAKVLGIGFAESYFNDLTKKNQQTYGALLNCYCLEKITDKAIAHFEKMKELNLASSSLVYGNLMNLHIKLGHPEKVQILFEDMKAMNVTPDQHTYTLLINSFALQNDMKSVEKIIKEMEESNLTLDWTMYSSIAAVYKSAGNLKKTESSLRKLEEVMDKHKREPYHHLISYYAGIGNSAEVHRVWKLLKDSFVTMTNTSYLIMLQALRKLEDIETLKQCFEEWDSYHTIYDRRLLVVAIGAYLSKGMVGEAECLWKKAREKSESFDFGMCELFIGYYLKNQQMDMAIECLETIVCLGKEKKWKPNIELVNDFLKYFKERKNASGQDSNYRNLKKLNSHDVQKYESLLRTYLAAGKKDRSFRPLINK